MNIESIKKIFVIAMFGFLLWGILHSIVITIVGLRDNLQYSDVAVVLGNKVELNGEPSERLKSRLDRGIELYNKGYFPYIIVSGGIGKEGFDEAKVMKEYMISEGVPAEVIIEDGNGYNSMLTAINSKAIMEEMGLESVMVISQYFHIARTKLAFRKVGVQRIHSAHGRFFEMRDFYSIFREVIGYYKYLFM